MTRWVSAALVLAALAVPAAARADGDPASDYLLTQPIFTPIDVKLPAASIEQLRTIQADAKGKGYEVRVALIATRYDLGAVPSLFDKPQAYAAFLHQEVQFVYKGPLLIVMPGGYGYFEPDASSHVVWSKKPSEYPDLAQAAVPVVQLLAKQHGVDVAIPSAGGGSSEWRDRAIIAAAAVVVLGLLAGALRLRRRPLG